MIVLAALGAVVVTGLIVGLLVNLGGHHAEPLDTERSERWLVTHVPRPLRRMLRAADRRVAGGSLIVTVLLVVFAGAAAVGWILDTVDENRGLARWDESAAEWGAENATDTSTAVLEFLTRLGGTEWLLVILALVGVYFAVRHRRPIVLGYLAVVGIGVVLLNNGLKLLVERERPAISQLTGHSGFSFPSGHSAAAAACWAALAFVVARRASTPVRALVAAGAVAITFGVAASRVLLGVHWLTDVVAGVLTGWVWFVVVTVVFGGRLLRFGEPAERAAAGRVTPTPEARAETDQSLIDHQEITT